MTDAEPTATDQRARDSGADARDDIVVTASSVATIDNRPILDTPRTVQAISAATIEQIPPRSLHEVVRYFAALTPGRAFTTQVADFSSRGVFTSVREDRLPLTRVSVPLEDFSRVELLQRVGDATQAGDKSPGGILNFVSKTPGPEAFARLNLVADDHGNLLSQADLNLPLDDRTGMRLDVGLERVRFANDTNGSRQSLILAGRHAFAPGIVLDLHGHYTSTPLRQNFHGYFPLDPNTGRPPPLSYDRRYGQRWARNNFRTGLIAGRLTADLGGDWSVQAGGNYYKAGAKYQAGPLVASFSAFRFKRPSEFDVPTTDVNGTPGSRKEQGGSTRYRGLDASLTGRVLPHLTVVASVALVDTRILESDTPSFIGQQLASTPKYTAALFAEDEFLRGRFVAGGVKYSSSQQVDQTGVFQVPGYTLFDAGLRHETTFKGRPVHVGLFAENLANKMYFPGTSYQSVQLGGPRTIKLSFGVDL